MSARWYKIVGADDLDAWLSRGDCVTGSPRMTADGSRAMVKLSAQVDGSMTRAAALAEVAGSDWRTDSPGPS